MRYLRAFATSLSLCLYAAAAGATGCPPVDRYQYFFSYTGGGCNYQSNEPCTPGEAVTMTLWGYSPALQSCDVITWDFGDGTSAVGQPGEFTATHIYAAPGSYSVVAKVANSSGAPHAGPYTVTVGFGSISTESPYASVQEGAAAVVRVHRSTSVGSASVRYDTVDGTVGQTGTAAAVAGINYTPVSGTLTFSAGETDKTIAIPTLDDGVYKPTGFTFRLLSATDAVINPPFANEVIHIIDADRAVVKLESTEYSVPETAGSVNVRVLRSGDPSAVVTVSYEVETRSITGVLTFQPGENTKDIAVPIPHDDAFGVDPIVVDLRSTSVNATFADCCTRAVIRIQDDTPRPVVTFDSVSAFEGDYGSVREVNVGVTLSQKTAFRATVQLFFLGSARMYYDYDAETSVTFLPGTSHAFVKIRIFGNRAIEPARTVIINGITSSSSGDFNPERWQKGTGLVTILDDDAQVTPSRLTIESGRVAAMNVRFGSAPQTPLTLTLRSSDPAVATVADRVMITATSSSIDVLAKSAGHAVITTTLPPEYGGTGYTINVDVTGGAVATPDMRPTLAGVTPSSGSTGGGTVVSVAGTNIGSGCWPFFDGVAARSATVDGTTRIVAVTPPHANAGAVRLTLRCSNSNDVVLADAFTYSNAPDVTPVITAVDPLAAAAGELATITGSRFRLDDIITFNDTVVVTVGLTPTTRVVRVPDLAPGAAAITLTDALRRASAIGPSFLILEPRPPQITNVTPSTTRRANEITVEGSGFRPGQSFILGNQPATTVELAYGRAVLRIPQIDAGSYALEIADAGGKLVATGPQVTIAGAGLAVQRVWPPCATSDGGTLLTVAGAGFAPGATVTAAGVAVAGVSVVDQQTITLTLPPLAPGSPRIVITNANGDSAALSHALAIVSPYDPNGCVSKGRAARH